LTFLGNYDQNESQVPHYFDRSRLSDCQCPKIITVI
jgi:hypothetical protein